MKPQKLSYNELDIREEEKFAPPTSVDIIPIEKAALPDEKLSSFAIIKRMLKRFNLKLGADIRYLPLENEYYIYPNEK